MYCVAQVCNADAGDHRRVAKEFILGDASGPSNARALLRVNHNRCGEAASINRSSAAASVRRRLRGVYGFFSRKASVANDPPIVNAPPIHSGRMGRSLEVNVGRAVVAGENNALLH